ncbi:MAG TPA: sugar ABC transporter permease [Paenibacillaceae bacterium]
MTGDASRIRRRNSLNKGLFLCFFIGPALLVYTVYNIYPIFATFFYSLFDWTGIENAKTYVGLENYARLIRDHIFLRSLGNNILLVFASVLTQIPLGLALALLLQSKIRGMRFFRTVYFLPFLMSTVAIAILWMFIYNPTFGVLNQVLGDIGLSSLQRSWLGEKSTAMGAVIATICWQFTPFYMILLRAGLTGIPEELLEAARIDGCTPWKSFTRITLPLLVPTLVTACVLSTIGSLKYFDLIYVMTEGGPDSATELMATYMYKQAFRHFGMGFASAISTCMFILSFIVAVAILSLDRYRARGGV